MTSITAIEGRKGQPCGTVTIRVDGPTQWERRQDTLPFYQDIQGLLTAIGWLSTCDNNR